MFTSDHGEILGDHWILHKLGWFDSSYHVPLIVRGPGVERGRVVADVFTEHVDVLPTICELLDTDVPLQCDGRPLTPWLRGETPADWRAETHFEFDFRDPDSPLLEEVFGMTMEECWLAVLRDEHGKYVQFAGHPALPPIFFDLDADPAQIHNVAGDPAYASRILDYAQRMLAWRMRHTERTLYWHEADDARGPRRAPRPPPLTRGPFCLATFGDRNGRPMSQERDVLASTADGCGDVLRARADGRAHKLAMEVVRGLTSGTGALFGGCGLGACIEVMER